MTGNCGGKCACKAAPEMKDSGALYVASATGHTLRTLARAAGIAGFRCHTRNGICRIEASAGVDAIVALANEVLTVTELEEARAVIAPMLIEPDSAFALGMSALPLATLAAQRRHRDIAGLLADESLFYSRYQPLFDLRNDEVFAYEALLRARDHHGNEIAPGPLFEAAEASGWVHILDRIGRETAIRNAAGWLGDRRLFVNFVPTSIYRPELCLRTTEAVARSVNVSLESIVFELVESHKVASVSHLHRIFDHYRSQGAQVALDDVGTGYSSLTMLAELQPDVVKIDMALVQTIQQEALRSVAKAIIDMAHGFGARVVAEGIETEEQLHIVRQLGADLGQGYLLGKPQLVEDLQHTGHAH